jgi:hypothetical protein
MKEFMVEYDEEYLNKYLKDYKELFDYITVKGLPPRHFARGDEAPWQCHYCGFTMHCLGMDLKKLKEIKYVTYPEEDKKD